jgi:tetratricopeptide (TPR) repeat protein
VQGSDKEGLLKKGLEAIAQGDTLSALSYFEKAINIEKSPAVCSSYAFCIAKERGQVSNAISLCEEAIQKEPGNSLHYLNLGRIYLIDNNRIEAIKTFREGLNYEANPLIVDELNKLGPRKPPILPFLKRSNPINRYLGIILRSKKWLRMFYILLSLLLAVVVSLLLPRLFLEKPEAPPPLLELEVKPEAPSPPLEDRPEVSPTPLEVKPEVATSAPEVIHEAPPKKPEVKQQVAPPPEVKHDKHTLELIAEDTTWIFITIDDSESKEMLLHQGDHIKLSAKNIFSLKIGNAGGIKVVFDGKEIGPFGEKDQVVTLTLPSPATSTNDILKKNSETE